MIKSLLKLAAILVVGILVYNYFFGTAEEKQQSEEIFISVKDLTKSAIGLLKTEKEKFDEGKYDEAVEKIGGLIDKLKGKAQQLKDNKELLDEIADLESQQRELSNRIRDEDASENNNDPPSAGKEQSEVDSAKRRVIEEGWKDLVQKTERVVEEMDRREQ